MKEDFGIMNYIKKKYLSKFFENKDGKITEKMLQTIKNQYFSALESKVF